MANDVALFTSGGNLAIPEHLRGIEVDEQTKALAGGGGGLRISIKGGVFRMLNNSEEIARNDDRAMNVVIVRSSPDTSRTYYAEAYVEGEDAKPPTCWSYDGVTPNPEVKEKQAASCATCPMNVAGSGNNGSRACRFSRNLAVVLEGDIEGRVFKLNLPATSIFGKIENNVMPLQAYGKLLVQHNLPVNAVVTELRFDTSVTQPKLGFKAARYLTKDEFEIAKKQGETPDAIAATTTTVFQQDSGSEPLQLPGKSPVEDAENVKDAPAVVQVPATTAASQPVTPPKRTRSKPAAAVSAAAEAASNAVSAESAESATTVSETTASAPSPEAGSVHKMTEKAEFTYEEYREAKWTDEMLIEEGLMEAPKKAAPPPAPKKAAPPPAPKKAPPPAPASKEPAVVKSPVGNSEEAQIQGTAALLAAWDTEEE